MSPTYRALLVSGVLLLLLLIAAVGLQLWVNDQSARLRRDALAEAAETVCEAAALAPRPPEQWDDAYRARLGGIINGTLTLTRRATGEAAPSVSGQVASLGFTRELPGHPGWFIHGTITQIPALNRLHLVQRRALAATIMLGFVFALAPALVAVVSARRAPSEATRSPWERTRAEAAGLERFARLTVESGEALQREQGERERAEESLRLSRNALDHSLEERIRLGRELHDNTSQTLYAVGLTLESVRKKMTATPEIQQRLDQCLMELRRLNQEVRAHIRELGPDVVRSEPLAVAFDDMLRGLVPEQVVLERRFDETALALVSPQQAPELVNLVREAISNSVRHGRASRIVLRAAHDAGALAFSISDDGSGFVPDAAATGHGLSNMRARASALGANFHLDSAPGKGTRVLLTLPVTSAS